MNNATLAQLGLSLASVVRYVDEIRLPGVVNTPEGALEYVSEAYDGAHHLTYVQAANAVARYLTGGAVSDISGIMGY